MKLLFVGDVVGQSGRRVLLQHLPALRTRESLDVVVVNAENAAAGFGITEKIAQEFFTAGVDVLTTGNHVWDKKEALEFILREPRLLRPHNYPVGTPGSGWYVVRKAGATLGVLNVMLAGAALNIGCVAVNLAGTDVAHFWAALTLLGIGWNFLFVGGTTLLTETYADSEKAKAQALNDFVVFTVITAASLSAGALQYQFGWRAVNLGVVPIIIVILAALLWLRKMRKTPPPVAVEA